MRFGRRARNDGPHTINRLYVFLSAEGTGRNKGGLSMGPHRSGPAAEVFILTFLQNSLESSDGLAQIRRLHELPIFPYDS